MFPFSDLLMQSIYYINDNFQNHWTRSLGLTITNCVFLDAILM